jgi:hypothetical protein
MEVSLDYDHIWKWVYTKAIIFSANQMGANDHVSYCFALPTKAIFYSANQF